MHEIVLDCIQTLKRGGIILYPTDTVWGIGCDATNADAIDRLYALKQRAESKAMICLVNDFKMLQQYVEEIPEMAYDILKYSNKPTTIVYPNAIRVAENVIAEDGSLGIRVVRSGFVGMLLKKYKKPIVSTSANISGEATPENFAQISDSIKTAVDFAVPQHLEEKNTKPSTVIKLELDGKVQILRK